MINEKYQDLVNSDPKTSNFSIKKFTNDITKNNIIIVKFLLCSLLNNYKKLVKTDFVEEATGNSEKILKELNIFINSSNIGINGTNLSEWYITSLLKYLKKTPEYLTENGCEKLYNEIENEIKHSINELDIEILLIILDKLKNVKEIFLIMKKMQKF